MFYDVTDISWRVRSACIGEDPELWFPISDVRSTAYILQVGEAKRVCAACPVRAECLETALAVDPHRDHHGVFGGLDPYERADLRRQRDAEQGVPALAS